MPATFATTASTGLALDDGGGDVYLQPADPPKPQNHLPRQNPADLNPAAAPPWLKQSAEAGIKYPPPAMPAGVTELLSDWTVG